MGINPIIFQIISYHCDYNYNIVSIVCTFSNFFSKIIYGSASFTKVLIPYIWLYKYMYSLHVISIKFITYVYIFICPYSYTHVFPTEKIFPIICLINTYILLYPVISFELDNLPYTTNTHTIWYITYIYACCHISIYLFLKHMY